MTNPPADLHCPTCGAARGDTHTSEAFDDLAVAGAFENRSLYREAAKGLPSDKITTTGQHVEIVASLRDGIWAYAKPAADLIEQQSASLASKDAEIAGLKAALSNLHGAAKRVNQMGAQTGSQWLMLTIALGEASSALAAGKEQGDGR